MSSFRVLVANTRDFDARAWGKCAAAAFSTADKGSCEISTAFKPNIGRCPPPAAAAVVADDDDDDDAKSLPAYLMVAFGPLKTGV